MFRGVFPDADKDECNGLKKNTPIKNRVLIFHSVSIIFTIYYFNGIKYKKMGYKYTRRRSRVFIV